MRLFHCALLALTGFAQAVIAADALAGDAAPAAVTAPRFRRILAPAAEIARWPRGAMKYLPITSAELDRVLKIANSGQAASRTAAHVAAAEYRARFENDHLVDGAAKLAVVSAEKSPTTLALWPCNLAVTALRWEGDGQREAVSGLAGDGRCYVQGARSGGLSFSWSLQGVRAQRDDTTFEIELPESPANVLTLELPADRVPLVDGGIVAPREWIDEDWRLWNINLGGNNRVRLEIGKADPTAPEPGVDMFSESIHYVISQTGVEVTCQWTISAFEPGPRDLVLSLAAGLGLTRVTCNEVAVGWSEEGIRETGRQVSVALPELAAGQFTRVVRLTATQPIVSGRAWTLPRMRPSGILWRNGRIRLAVDAALEVRSAVGQQLRQIASHMTMAPASAEYQCLAPEAALTVTVEPAAPVVELAGGTAVELSGTGATARFVGDLQAASGAQFVIEALVAGNWQIDSVETLPADRLEDWSVDRVGNQRVLAVRLSKPIIAAQPVRLIVTARRPGSLLGQQIGLRHLVPLQFNGVVSNQRLISLRALEPYQLEAICPATKPAGDFRSLGPVQREWLGDGKKGPVFDETTAGEVELVLRSQEPSFAAEIAVEATVAGGRLRESYRIRCVPDSGALENLHVQFGPARDIPLQWSLAGPIPRALVGRRLPAAASSPAAAEVWHVALPRPLDEPFEILGTRDMPLERDTMIALASVPDATNQTGVCRVYHLGPEALRINNARLVAVPSGTAAGRTIATLRGAFAFDPVRELAATEPALTVAPVSQADAAWVWLVHCDSAYDAAGDGRHTATFLVENTGARQMVFRAPEDAEIRGECELWVDRSRVACSGGNGATHEIHVDLPVERRFVTIVVSYATAGAPLSAAGRVALALPRCDVPIMDRRWTVRLPPGYRACDAETGRPRVPPAPPTLSQRLFGPVGRAPEASVAGLWPEPAQNGRAAANEQQHVETFLQSLGEQELPQGSRITGVTLTWGELLAVDNEAGLADRLLIDQAAFRALGLAPHTPVKRIQAENDLARGLAVLRTADVAVLSYGRTLLLTSRSEAAMWDRWLTPSCYADVWQVRPGPLASVIAAAAQRPDPALLPADTWRQTPEIVVNPWEASAIGPARSSETPGWSIYQPPVADDGRASLSFCYEPSVRVAGAAVLFAVWGMAHLVLRRRPRLMAVAILLAVAAALATPAVLLPIGAGAVLGLLLCVAVAWLSGRWQEPPSAPQQTDSPASTVALPSSAALSLLLLVVPAALGLAAEPAPPAAATVYDVFVPIDERQQPTGDKLYIPEPFYRELHRHVAAQAAPAQSWLIGHAVYRGALQNDSAREHYTVDELQAEFDLHVFARSSRIRLPLRRDDANLLSDTVTLDGEPLEVEWEPDGSALVFDVPEAGRYRLALALRPARAGAGIDVGIPPVLDARLELSVPTAAPAPVVTTARGAVRWETEPRRLLADLGPTRRLAMHWATPAAVVAAAVDAEQLLWWRLEPSAAVLDVRLRLRVLEGQCQELRVTTDTTLRACPPVGRDAPTMEVEPVSSTLQRLVFRWPRPVTDTAMVEFTLVPQAAAVEANVPRLDMADVRATRRWVAVSVDPALETHQTNLDAVEAVGTDEFVQAWGRAAAPPLLAVRPIASPSSWQLSTTPRRSQVTVEPTETVSFGEEEAVVRCAAQGEVVGLPVFQLNLDLPSDLEVTHVAVRRSRDEAPLRWALAEGGRLSVFFDTPLAGRFTLTLHGRSIVGTKRRVAVPLVRFAEAETAPTTLYVYRQPPVSVSLSVTAGVTVLPEAAGPEDASEQFGRPISSYRVAATVTKLWANVAPNRPTLGGSQLTVVRRAAGGWTTEVHAHLTIAGGLLDEIPLEASDSLIGPYATDFGTPVQMVDLPGERRRLMLRPPQSLTGEVHFRFDAALAVPAAERLNAPLVRIADAARVKRFIALPRRIDGAPATWETIGLRPATVSGFSTSPFEPDDYDLFEYGDDSSRAALTLTDQRQGAARVRQADVAVAWTENGECRGTAVFDFDAGRAVDCPLWMPAGLKALQVTINDLPVCPVGGRSLVIPFGPQRLPLRIEVLFAGRLPDDAAPHQRIEMPTLGELPIAQTLWTLYPPRGTQSVVETSATQGNLAVAFARLRNTAAVISQTTSSPALEETQRAAWYRQWSTRLAADYRLAQSALTEEGRVRTVTAERAELNRINEQQAALAARLGMPAVLGDASAVDRGPQGATDVLRATAAQEGRQPFCLESRTPLTAVTVELRSVSTASAWRWLLAAAALALAFTLVIPWGRRWGHRAALHATRWAKRYPHAVGVLLGLAWILWLSPIAIGWCLVFGSLAALLWRAAPRRPVAARL